MKNTQVCFNSFGFETLGSIRLIQDRDFGQCGVVQCWVCSGVVGDVKICVGVTVVVVAALMLSKQVSANIQSLCSLLSFLQKAWMKTALLLVLSSTLKKVSVNKDEVVLDVLSEGALN